ncbi:nuclear transport factor 2 family protein [Natrinema halophilum]|uniref:Nuclear transport factor 2 family protein n=1 Tax=Natrinema halophilum TaxID=1699371 RepID=A0A7D5GU23_9EURY|nr:nuclear transport factor 2 family protein [Natrinema halophilum]QLG50449.1 nuclear transport factor 2 family protein [Natrinema halophilum]
MTSNEHRSIESATARERLTEFYTEFNHVVTNHSDVDEFAAVLRDDVRWTDVTTGNRSDRTYAGIDDVLENVVLTPSKQADHLQALPERFTDAGDTVVVEGAYVGTVDGRNFDIAFAHVFDLTDGMIEACRAFRDTALEQRVFDA